MRNRGTIGGSVANNDPTADYPAAVLALDATVVTDRREIPADDFFKGLFETALQPGEIITAVRFPLAASGGLCQVRQSGVALCDRRRVRREVRRRRACRGHRCGPVRVPAMPLIEAALAAGFRAVRDRRDRHRSHALDRATSTPTPNTGPI